MPLLHIAPIEIQRNDNGSITVTPEACISFSEGTEIYDYILGLIRHWNYYVSHTVTIPNASAKIEVSVIDANGTVSGQMEDEDGASAYIYGWVPESPEWFPGQCVAFVNLNVPPVTVLNGAKCIVHTILMFGDTIVADEMSVQKIIIKENYVPEAEFNE